MGGKSSGGSATNNQMVQMQMQQAAQAQAANVARTGRLKQGVDAITNLFQGTPKGSAMLDLSSLASGAVTPGDLTGASGQLSAGGYSLQPGGGYTYTGAGTGTGSTDAVYNALPGGGYSVGTKGGGLLPGYSMTLMPDDGSGTPSYGLYGPSGLLATGATPQDLAKNQIYVGGDATQRQDPFAPMYSKLRQSVLDYYLPQEDQQFQDAKSSLGYNLARAGTLDSSIAHTDQAKLTNQDQINQAQIAANAENQVGSFRTTVQQDQQSALNQLYSTEDPTVAANTAGNMVANAQLTKPMLNPAGALFAPIMAGVGTALTGFTNPYAYINSGAQGNVASTPGPGGGVSQNVNA